VPGPQFPLYVLGREILEAYPVAFLPENHALAIAIMSYNGQMNFGLLGDFDAVPDIDMIGHGIEEELATLVALRSRARPCGQQRPRLELVATASVGLPSPERDNMAHSRRCAAPQVVTPWASDG